MKRPYKVRFNLGAGKNYMKWKIEGPDGTAYYSPNEVQIIMMNCQLKNQKSTAQKIHDGAHKTVCAWIKCGSLVVTQDQPFNETNATQLKYNPRVRPNWYTDTNENADNMTATMVFSSDRKLYTI